jgi:hypothetical protein
MADARHQNNMAGRKGNHHHFKEHLESGYPMNRLVAVHIER